MRVTESWRNNQNWAKYLGREGVVVATTLMEVAATDQVAFLPYAYLVVDLGEERISLMGVAGESFTKGDLVKIVLRKIKKEAQAEVIAYGLKATHV
jgi:uncharacterized OB-fold protein